MVVHVPQELIDEIQKYNQELKKYEDQPKWQWPSQIVKKLHNVSEQIRPALTKDLYNLMAWPNSDSADPKGFYREGKDTLPGHRPVTGWYESQGYKKHTTTYTYAAGPDKRELTAAFYIPINLKSNTEVPFMWFFHGGGFCTGANDLAAWHSQASLKQALRRNTIIIAPDYPLGPEGNYQDIADAMRDFLRFYKEDGCFEPEYTSWKEWLASKIIAQGLSGVTMNKERIFVEGESAGGHTAIIALFLNADKITGTKISIKAALLRYPMLKHYARSFTGDTMIYMGETCTKAQLEDRADKIKQVIDELEALQLVPTCTRAEAPFHMCNAFLLSVLSPRWQDSFQRQHNGGKRNDDFDIKDCLERARDSGDKVDHELLPPIYMYHGTQDANCKIEDSRVFKEFLVKNYPGRYVNGKTVVLSEVAELDKDSVAPGTPNHVGHAFDYDLDEEREAWLKEAYAWVHKLW